MKSAQQSKAHALPASDMDVLVALLDAAPWPDTDMDMQVLAAMLGPLEALEALLDRPVSGACP